MSFHNFKYIHMFYYPDRLSLSYFFGNRKEFEMGQMNSKVENEKNLVSQLQKTVKELQVASYKITLRAHQCLD